jgi:hypothetical protein
MSKATEARHSAMTAINTNRFKGFSIYYFVYKFTLMLYTKIQQ